MKQNLFLSSVIIFITTILLISSVQNNLFAQDDQRPMNFLDILKLRSIRETNISPDGNWFIYTLFTPDFKKNNKYSDIFIIPLTGGESKQKTFTKNVNESSLKWYKSGSFFAFLSNDSENKRQIFFMNPDSGETWQVTDDQFGVSSYEWSNNGKHLAFLSGKSDEKQIWIMPGEGGDAEKLTDHNTPVKSYLWHPNSKKIYFVAPDSIDLLDKERKKKKFNVVIKDQSKITNHLWKIDIETKKEKRLTSGNDYSINAITITISKDGNKIAFLGDQTDRYAKYYNREIYILDLNANKISRITNNSVNEGILDFSPDSKWFAFSMPNGEVIMNLRKIYIVSTQEGKIKKLLNDFNYQGSIGFWSIDSRYIYFPSGIGVNGHLFRVSIDDDKIEQITDFNGRPHFIFDNISGKYIISYSDWNNPTNYYHCKPENLNDKDKWIKLTDSNPQVNDFNLGKSETIEWKSTDDTTIEGLLIKPSNYDPNIKYPLMVQLHGGPYQAYTNNFRVSCYDYVHIYTANNYVVFQPNYRGSSRYGEKFSKEIAGDFFGLSYDDIMSGVDYLIEKGIAHPDSMGIMGFSAGGMLSNWILVSTDRFKAISTFAGKVNSISGFDENLWSEYYIGETPYNNWDHYVQSSPIRYIKNAKTPTLIHCGERDRNNLDQCNQLYIALKKLRVPTEFIVYPNTGHGIRNMRYQMVKMHAEFNWFEKWIRGKKGWIDWREMIDSLDTN